MLGWHVTVYRLNAAEPASASFGAPSPAELEALRRAAESPGTEIAVWQTGVRGLRWLDELVKGGHAIEIAHNGYPTQYVGPARHLLAPIFGAPPDARAVWVHGVGDIVGPGWKGATTIDGAAAAACSPDDLLLVEAWDES